MDRPPVQHPLAARWAATLWFRALAIARYTGAKPDEVWNRLMSEKAERLALKA